MQYSPKYHIHAEIRTSGVVERSDVVGAVFGQTEGLLGDELDLRELQENSEIGRIDVAIDSEDGRSFGTITIGSGMDRVKTAVLAASLETIERVGPCRAECTITRIEDARAAKRRKLVDRATELLADLEETTMTSESLIDAVEQRARVEDITEYEGLPAGPRVADSDAIIVVEGRADVRRLLRFGIKNAIAVEGTDIPDAVARLTTERTTTAFLDGDRGGDLITRELEQVGEIDYIAFAPEGTSVEDLDRSTLLSSLRKKIPYDRAVEATSAREAFAPGTTDTAPEEPSDEPTEHPTVRPPSVEIGETDEHPDTPGNQTERAEQPSSPDGGITESAESATPDSPEKTLDTETTTTPQTLTDHVRELLGEDTGQARLLDESVEQIDECDQEVAFQMIEETTEQPQTLVIDGTVTQRLLDVSAQRGVEQILARDTGEFVKQPVSVRLRTGDAIESMLSQT